MTEQEKMDKAVEEKIRMASAAVNRKYEAQYTVPGPDNCASDIPFFVPAHNTFLFNKLLGGGVPVCRIMEIYGDPSVGKSTIVEQMMIGFQKYPGLSILLDADTGWHRGRAERMGHNSQRHMHIQVDTLELSLDLIKSNITRLRMPGVGFPMAFPIGFFYDAISASQTEGEKIGDQYKDGQADSSRKVRQGLRTLAPMLAANNCALVFICHTIQQLKSFKGRPAGKKSASHGDAIKFWSAKRIKIYRSGKVHYPADSSGIMVCATTVKDKIDVPDRVVDIPIMHKTGGHLGYELINYLIDNSVWVNIDGNYIVVPDFPEPCKELAFYRKDLDHKLSQFPALIPYLLECAEETWVSLNG